MNGHKSSVNTVTFHRFKDYTKVRCVDHLSTLCNALGLIPSITKNSKQTNRQIHYIAGVEGRLKENPRVWEVAFYLNFKE